MTREFASRADARRTHAVTWSRRGGDEPRHRGELDCQRTVHDGSDQAGLHLHDDDILVLAFLPIEIADQLFQFMLGPRYFFLVHFLIQVNYLYSILDL